MGNTPPDSLPRMNHNPMADLPTDAVTSIDPDDLATCLRVLTQAATLDKTHPDSVNVSRKGPYYFNQIRVDPNDDKVVFLTGDPGGMSRDGGKTWGRIFNRFFGDNRTFWFDPENSSRVVMGSDGGIAVAERCAAETVFGHVQRCLADAALLHAGNLSHRR